MRTNKLRNGFPGVHIVDGTGLVDDLFGFRQLSFNLLEWQKVDSRSQNRQFQQGVFRTIESNKIPIHPALVNCGFDASPRKRVIDVDDPQFVPTTTIG